MEKWIQEGFLKRCKGKSILNFPIEKYINTKKLDKLR